MFFVRARNNSPFALLWVSQLFIDRQLFAFTSSQAADAPDSAPHITLTLPDLSTDGITHNISAFGFAPNGDMWVGDYDVSGLSFQSASLAKISASKLLTSASVTPDFAFPIAAAGISTGGVSAILFTPAGDMWVSTVTSTGGPAGILRYSAASIAAPGSPSPSVVLRQVFPPTPDNPLHSNSANDLWFDPLGNLWFTNAIARTINRLSASQLLASNPAVVPDIILSLPAQPYSGCALDAAGNIWATWSAGGQVDMFAVNDILASGSPTPTRSIYGYPAGAGKLRFDKSGNLWVQTPNGPVAFSPFDISVSGSPQPRSALTGAGAITAAKTLNFNPASFV